MPGATMPGATMPGAMAEASASVSANAVVLEYCAAVRGILNDDQGGPLHPPGLRMADALGEVRESVQRNLDEKKGASPKRSSGASRAASTGDSTRSVPSRSRSAPA